MSGSSSDQGAGVGDRGARVPHEREFAVGDENGQDKQDLPDPLGSRVHPVQQRLSLGE